MVKIGAELVELPKFSQK